VLLVKILFIHDLQQDIETIGNKGHLDSLGSLEIPAGQRERGKRLIQCGLKNQDKVPKVLLSVMS